MFKMSHKFRYGRGSALDHVEEIGAVWQRGGQRNCSEENGKGPLKKEMEG